MIRKSLLKTLIGISMLGENICLASDSFNENEKISFSLTAKQLKKGYELTANGGYLELSDGTRWSVTNKHPGIPNFDMFPHVYQDNYYGSFISGGYSQSTKDYNFTYFDSFPEFRWNEESKQWESDLEKFSIPLEVFSLNLKPILDNSKINNEKQINSISENKLTTSSFLNTISFSNTVKEEVPAKEDSLFDLSQFQSSSSQKSLPLLSESIQSSSNSNNYLTSQPLSRSIISETGNFKSASLSKVYSEHVPSRNLWIGLEQLTSENINWWKSRLGWDAYMHFNAETQREQLMMQDPAMQQQMHQANEWMSQNASPFRDNIPEEFTVGKEVFMLMRDNVASLNAEDIKEFEKLYGQYPDSSYELGNNYLRAWRGFKYNLDNHAEVPTFIAYVSSKSIDNPLHTIASPLTPDIKMMMTLTLGERFYSPLGIYRSPISEQYDKMNGVNNRNISMLFHSQAAGLVKKVNPEAKYMVVKPIDSMATIFSKSGIPYSNTSNHLKNSTLPVIGVENNHYALKDPARSTTYQIENSHWFNKSPFLGDGNGLEFPVYTLDIETLANFDPKA